MRKILLAPALALLFTGTAAFASDDDGCTKAPKEQWLKLGDIEAKLTGQGYAIREVEFEDGCVEAKVTDKDGKHSELKLDPVTAEVVKSDGRKNSDR